jgi:ABC-2 type transport system permease protein
MSTAALSLPAASTGLARTLRIFLTETRYEFIRMLRTRTFSLSVIGFPVMFYVLFGLLMNRGENIDGTNVLVAKYMLGSYAVFGVVGAALFGIGVGVAADLSAGWLELKRASPMPPIAYLLAKCVTAMAFGVIIVNILTILGISFANVHLSLYEYLRMIGLTIIGAFPFACLGLVIASIVPFNSAPGIANLIYLPMSFCSGLWVPYQFLPKALKAAAPYLPTFHLAQLQLHSLGAPALGTTTSHWLGLASFTCIMLGIAVITFRRREQNS